MPAHNVATSYLAARVNMSTPVPGLPLPEPSTTIRLKSFPTAKERSRSAKAKSADGTPSVLYL